MTTTRRQYVDRLAAIAKELAQIAAGLNQPDEVPQYTVRQEVRDLVDELLRRQICLSREHKLKDGERPGDKPTVRSGKKAVLRRSEFEE